MPPMNEPTIQKPLRPLGHLNKKILESAGDIGVPRIQKVKPTVAKEFNLSSSARPTTARKKVDVPDESNRPLYSSFGSKAGAAAFAKPSVVAKPKALPPKPAAKPAVPKAAVSAPKGSAAPSKAAAASKLEETKTVVEPTVEPVDVSELTAAEPTPAEPAAVEPTTAEPAPAEPAAAEPVDVSACAAVAADEYAPIMELESAWAAAHAEKAQREAAEEAVWREAHEEDARREALLAAPLDPMEAAWVEAHYDNAFREQYGPKAHNDAMAMDAWEEAHAEKARREAALTEKTNVRRVFATDALPAYLAEAEAEEGEASDDEADSDYAPTPKEAKTRAFAAIKAAGTPVAASIEAAAAPEEEAPAAPQEEEAVAAPEPPVVPASPVARSPAKKVLASPAKAVASPAVRQSPRRQPPSAQKGPATSEERLTEAIRGLLAAEPGIGVKRIVEKLQEASLGFEVSAKAVRAIRQQM